MAPAQYIINEVSSGIRRIEREGEKASRIARNVVYDQMSRSKTKKNGARNGAKGGGIALYACPGAAPAATWRV